MQKKFICICCPIGCEVTASLEKDIYNISGNKCPRGENYVKEEIISPKRMVTATCATDSKEYPRLPVKTVSPIPKELIFSLLEEIYKIEVKVPVKSKDIIIKNFNNLNIDVIATLTIDK